MKILFVHQNFPGQFLHLAPALVDRGHQVVALTDETNTRTSPITTYRYRKPEGRPDPREARLGTTYAEMTNRAYRAARAARQLRDKHGFVPDVVFGHGGWGETLFLREIWPEARHLLYAELYYSPHGLDVGFDPEFGTADDDKKFAVIARQGHQALMMTQCDAALSPTEFQADTFPTCFRDKITIIHDGIDTDRLRPDPQARAVLPSGVEFRAGDEVLTFVNRNLEPYRGYHSFVRALPEVLRARPKAQVVIIGGDDVSYGPRPGGGRTWKEIFLDEVRDRIDLSRVHFTGKVPYPTFAALMQCTRVHCYLTVPFVLSWSLLEAMSAGALVVGSRTAPVEELIRDGVTGRLVDFFDTAEIAETLIDGLADPVASDPLRAAARALIVENYDLKRLCLPRLIGFVEGVA
ncbi:MAG: glycosyltransferase [Rhodobacter sp.]|uniref:glycosyltransferase n=1 Tax=Pararhodobacter sp. TaxID=2127056 RepID=UPI002CF8656B|nr:glycosyltransferase [Pararhodobacter sp.]MCC0072214.1 glycosyltransferase [Rhodobacter sp.]HPD92785.1 glycosyltransferase [Pararhodobacter sp.]